MTRISQKLLFLHSILSIMIQVFGKRAYIWKIPKKLSSFKNLVINKDESQVLT